MLKLGIRGKMLLVIISLLMISFATIAGVGYIQAKKIIIKQADMELITKTDYMREKMLNFFSKREMILQGETKYVDEILGKVKENNNSNTVEKQNIKNHFIALLPKLKEEYGIIDIYIAYQDGNVDCGSGWVSSDPNWKATERPWYKKAIKSNGELVYTDIYVDSQTKKPVVTLSQAVKNNENGGYAVVAIDIRLTQLAELFSKEKIGDTGYPCVLDNDGRFLIHPKYSFNEDISKADTIFNVSKGSLKEIGKKILLSSGIVKGEVNGITKVYYSEFIKGTGFNLVSTLSEEEFTRNLDKFIMSIALIMCFSMLFCIIFICMFIGRITRILYNIVDGMKQMANGNLTYKMNNINRNDELGILAKSIDEMQCSVKNIIESTINETDNVNKSLNILRKNIIELTDDLENTSETVDQLVLGMDETSSATEEINAVSVEIETVIENIAEKAQVGAISANEISNKALALKDSSVALENEAHETRINIKKAMDEALEKSKSVEKIKVLSDSILQISSQTNLLALNAAIEAARAGEAGKGFSIVADEIRILAEDTKKTVNEIQSTVKTVFEAVENLADTSKQILSYIETKVVEGYKESVEVGKSYEKDADYVNDLVADLSANTEELLASIKTISHGIEEISNASNEGTKGTSNIADKVLSITNRANEVKLEITHVKESADALKCIVSNFKV